MRPKSLRSLMTPMLNDISESSTVGNKWYAIRGSYFVDTLAFHQSVFLSMNDRYNNPCSFTKP